MDEGCPDFVLLKDEHSAVAVLLSSSTLAWLGIYSVDQVMTETCFTVGAIEFKRNSHELGLVDFEDHCFKLDEIFNHIGLDVSDRGLRVIFNH